MPRALDDFCTRVQGLDSSIRFAGVVDRKGVLVGRHYRKGLSPLLTREEVELSAMQAVIRSATRETLEGKLGRAVFSITSYQKVKRAAIPIRKNSWLKILMLSFDPGADAEAIITGKVIPMLDTLDL
ncbi:hypothetical protein [Nitrososphaera sp.]|uniref:hypothetical protein n=1 Tax=Nitrososphaera sp. TaxID=1971748 RepID=UPI00307D0155